MLLSFFTKKSWERIETENEIEAEIPNEPRKCLYNYFIRIAYTKWDESVVLGRILGWCREEVTEFRIRTKLTSFFTKIFIKNQISCERSCDITVGCALLEMWFFPSFPKGYRTEINERKIVSLVEEVTRLSISWFISHSFLIVSETFFMDVNFSRKSVSKCVCCLVIRNYWIYNLA